MLPEIHKLQKSLKDKNIVIHVQKMRIHLDSIKNIEAVSKNMADIADIMSNVSLLKNELCVWKNGKLHNPKSISTSLTKLAKLAQRIEAYLPVLNTRTVFSTGRFHNSEYKLNPQGWNLVQDWDHQIAIESIHYSFSLPLVDKSGLVKPIDIQHLLMFVDDLQASCQLLTEEKPWAYDHLLEAWSKQWSKYQDTNVTLTELNMWVHIWKYMHCEEPLVSKINDILPMPNTIPEMYNYIQNILSINQQFQSTPPGIELDLDL